MSDRVERNEESEVEEVEELEEQDGEELPDREMMSTINLPLTPSPPPIMDP